MDCANLPRRHPPAKVLTHASNDLQRSLVMNAIIGAVCLAVLSGINYRVSGSFRYPPALFAGWWALLLAALASSGKSFYPISGSTIAIYIIGPCAMSLGGVIGLVSWHRSL